jgi:hypothetical protein
MTGWERFGHFIEHRLASKNNMDESIGDGSFSAV